MKPSKHKEGKNHFPSQKSPNISIYTDGSCKPNPGAGGWAAIILRRGKKPTKLCGCEQNSTNNRMELTAPLHALKSFGNSEEIRIYTDSKYLREGVTKWLSAWEKRGWKTTENTEVKNQELWKDLAQEITRHKIDWKWTKGHVGNKWNERADALARGARQKRSLPLNQEGAIHMFTAASFKKTERNGGWGVLLKYKENIKLVHGTAVNTSGNRMHLQATIEGLKAIKKPFPLNIYTTSSYLKDGATHWVSRWAHQGWISKEGDPIKNQDLWTRLYPLLMKYEVTFHLVSKEQMPEEMTLAKNSAKEGIGEIF